MMISDWVVYGSVGSFALIGVVLVVLAIHIYRNTGGEEW